MRLTLSLVWRIAKQVAIYQMQSFTLILKMLAYKVSINAAANALNYNIRVNHGMGSLNLKPVYPGFTQSIPVYLNLEVPEETEEILAVHVPTIDRKNITAKKEVNCALCAAP